jgi:hypothetical protein
VLINEEEVLEEKRKSRIIGYDFIGWKDNNGQWIYEKEFFENIILIPVFAQNYDSGIPSFELPALQGTETKKFMGWSFYPNASSGMTNNFIPATITTTLYAIWKVLKEYTVTILPNEFFGSKTIEKTYIGENNTVILKTLLEEILEKPASLGEYQINCYYYADQYDTDYTLETVWFEEPNNYYKISNLKDEKGDLYNINFPLVIDKSYKFTIIP